MQPTARAPQQPSPRPTAAQPDPLAHARALHAAGKLDAANQLYTAFLAHAPQHPEALFFQALLRFQQTANPTALDGMRQALALAPNNAILQTNFGVTLQSASRLPEALPHFRTAVELDPTSAPAQLNLGQALLRADQPSAAATHLSRTLSLDPNQPHAADALGTALQRLGQPDRALICFHKAISLQPTFAEAHNNLANVLDELGRHADAIASYREAIAVRPDFAEAHSNLANTLRALGHLTEAEAAARRAIALAPTFAEAHLNLGNALKEQGRLAAAADTYLHVLALAPTHPGAHNNLAETLKEQGRIEEAASVFTRALHLQPPSLTAFSNLLYLHASTRDIPPEAEANLARQWELAALTPAERAAARHRATAGVFPALSRHGRPLRLGIVSAELGTHAVAEFLEPWLERLRPDRFHLTLFPTSGRSCERARRLHSLAGSVVPLIGLPDSTAADRIRREQIDVLVDTTGHTSGCRLGIFAHRAAPVQCTYIGYWSTTGLTEMDWFLSDPDAQPASDHHYTEALWRLPRIAVSYRGDRDLPLRGWSPSPDGTLWLGSFNKYSKIRDETLALWAEVLHALPEARLLLEDRAPDERETQRRILGALTCLGIAPHRVTFEPFVPGHERHMRLYHRLDIALDTLPFNSGTTAFDALWMGVPLVALEGTWTGGRMGSSVLKSLGRPEWIAQTPADYVRIVTALARNLPLRRTLRQTQRDQMAQSPLCDGRSLTRALEDAFETMYDRWLAGLSPTPHYPS